jgi:PRC-barrel domain
MTHYATLRDHQFDADIDDIRGATLYGAGGEKLARIDDVVFEHGSGNIEYLVANEGHGRRVLVPVNNVRTAITSDRDFDSDLTRADIDRLPAFDDHMLKHDAEWQNYTRLHRESLEKREEAAEREYKEGWKDDPVEHQVEDVAHLITPVEVPPARGSNIAANAQRVEDDYVPDLTPQRLAPVFTSTAQTSDKLNMVPQAEHSRGPAAEYVTAGLGPKWNGYQERIRRELPRLRSVCQTCQSDEKKIA